MAGIFPEAALKGIRILDFSWVLAGPSATCLLADFGAEVIKIQPLLPEADDVFSRAYYNNWNRNKLGLSLDMSKPQGSAIASRLIKISDAVVENFSPRVMTNWGLDYAGLKKIKTDIILLSLSVMGHSGPWRDYSGFGPAVQAFAGITDLTAYSTNNPLGPGLAYSDHVAGLYGALALQGALEYRARTGEGQFIDLSQTETMISLLAGPILERCGPPCFSQSPRVFFEGVFPCRGEDRWCAISLFSESEWEICRKVMGLAGKLEGPGFEVPAQSVEPADEQPAANNHKPLPDAAMNEMIREWTARHTAEEAAALLQSAGIAAEAVMNTADLASAPDLAARGFFVHLQSPESGDTISQASPIRLSETPAQYRRAAPVRGRDNQYVLGELLGMNENEIKELEREEVIMPRAGG